MVGILAVLDPWHEVIRNLIIMARPGVQSFEGSKTAMQAHGKWPLHQRDITSSSYASLDGPGSRVMPYIGDKCKIRGSRFDLFKSCVRAAPQGAGGWGLLPTVL